MILARLKKRLNYYEAVAALVGTIIGAGVLGIPFVVAKVGFGIGAIFIIVMSALIVVLHLMLGEVVARTSEPLQLVGLTRKYLGKGMGRLMGVSYVLSLNGILLAYMVGVGAVLTELFSGPAFVWSLIFFVCGAFLILKGVHVAKHVELVLTAVMVIVLIIIMVMSVRGFSFVNLQHASLKDIFLPFGVILFALSGITAIPLIEVIENKKREMKRAIVAGTLAPAVLYFLFALVAVAVTGSTTTEVATIGLGQAIGPLMLVLGSLFAVFAMSTSFVLVGLALVEVYDWDYKMKRLPASLVTCAVPLLFFLLGARHFINILGLVGSLFIAFEMILIVLTFLKARRIKQTTDVRYVRFPAAWAVILITFFVIAGALGVWEWLHT